MRSSTLFFMLALVFSAVFVRAQDDTETAIVGDYTDVDPSDWDESDYQDNLQVGLQKLVAVVIDDGRINPNDTTWRVLEIYSIQTQVVSGINYRYNVSIINEDNSTDINATIVVYNDASGNTPTLQSWRYVIHALYVPLRPLSLVNTNRVLNQLLNLGANRVVTRLQANGNVPEDETYTLKYLTDAQVRSFYPDNYYYRFSVGFTGDNNGTITSNFIVNYNTTSHVATFGWYSYVYTP